MIDRGALARAFSPGRNVRALWEPKSGHLAPLDGLRALSILWTIAFHAAWFLFDALSPARYLALMANPLMVLPWRGHFGVDGFFVLSGFLIAGMLLDERERTGRLRLGLFYVRRLMRLWPALLASLAIYVVVDGPDPSSLWTNALYVSNFVPVLRVSMGWTWSLAIEEHFYLVCPWLIDAIVPLSARARTLVLLALVLLGCGVAAAVAIGGDFHAIDTEIVLNRGVQSWARGYDALYSKPWMRVAPLLMGALAAVTYRSERAMRALAASGWIGTLGLALALVLAFFSGAWARFVGAPRWLELGYIASYRAIFGACVAYVLLLSISEHRVGRALGRVLGARLFHPIAQLAYAAYLVNPIVTYALQEWLAPQLSGPPIAMYAVLFPLDLLLTLAAAAVVHVLVERPFMELRPRAKDETSRATASRPFGVQLTAMLVLGVLLPLALLAIVPRLVPSHRTTGAHAAPPGD